MINLYIPTNNDFTNNGDATLQPISCEISETINGAWQLTMEIPYDLEKKYRKVTQGATLRVSNPSVREISNTQLYRIYDYKRNTRSMTVIAFPKAMEATFDAPIEELIIDSDITGASAASELNAVSQKYSVTSDVTETGRAVWTNTNLTKAIGGTDENAFVNVWGGEVAYDNTTFKIKERLGNSANPASVVYGKNINDISYEVDDSGLITRVYPLSNDGIRYYRDNKSYIDSDKIEDYPVIHTAFLNTGYTLVDTDANSVSRTAQKTANIKSRITALASSLSHSIFDTATDVDDGFWNVEYLAGITNEIIAAVQNACTTDIIHSDFKKVVETAIKNGMSWMASEKLGEQSWYEAQTDGWKYGNADEGRWLTSEWGYIDKKWRYFGNDQYWQEPADSDDLWTWYDDGSHKKYGSKDRYYLKGQYIYITESGTLKKYWLDGDGWYDSDKTDDSDWDWHESSTAAGAWWFGDEEGDNYMSGQWAFIDGTLYWFDDNGYYYGVKEEHPPFDWMESGEAFWFGNPDKNTRAVFLTSQWAYIDRKWYYFDSNGYAKSDDYLITNAQNIFLNGMSSLVTLVDTCEGEAYGLLYDLMEEWVDKKYAAGIDTPTITINVDMVDLSKTVDYKDFQSLEEIRLGDTVKCIDYVHAIATTERVVELTYDVLRGYNTKVTIGVANSSVGSMLSGATGGGGGESGYNSAINVEVIEQNLEMKNPTLVEGTNVKLTNNPDGTQTIDVDEPIRSGDHVRVTKNNDGSYTVNADGGALEYWIEENTKFYRKKVENVSTSYGWDCDSAYKWENDQTSYAFDCSLAGYADVLGFAGTYTDAGQCVFGIAKFTTDNLYYFVSVSSVAQATLHKVFSGTPNTYEFTYNGVTLYYSVCRLNDMERSLDLLTYKDTVVFTEIPTSGKQFPYYGEFDSGLNAARGLVEASHFCTKKIHYTGLSIDGQTMWAGILYSVGDVSSVTPTQMQFYVTDGGIVNGKDFRIDGETIYKVKDIIDNGESILVNKIADISHKQNKLTAGTNININSSTNEISATDTNAVADMIDVDIDDETLDDGQVLKWNSTTSKWENDDESGGSEVEANPSGTATSTLNKIGIDGTIYSIEGGGGGSGASGSVTTLFENTGTTSPASITLDDDLTNYDIVLFQLGATSGDAIFSMTYDVADLTVGDTIGAGSSTNIFVWYYYTNATTLTLRVSAGNVYMSKIVGIKFGGGGGTGSLNAEEMTSAEYALLPTADKEDETVIHFINDTVGGDVETAVDMTDFYNRYEGSMNISVNANGELVYYWNGGMLIGASSYRSIVIPSSVTKIKYKITTGTAYSTTTERFKIGIGVKATYGTSNWATAADTDWLAVDIQNTQNTTYEGEVDLSSVTSDSYLMIGCHGWNVTFNEITLVEEHEPTGSTKIMYKDVEYGTGGGSSGGSRFEKLAEYSGAGVGYAAGDTITLSESMTNFDLLMFSVGYANVTGYQNATVRVEQFKTQYTDRFYVNYNPATYVDVKYATDTTIDVIRNSAGYIFDVYGIKFGGGSGDSPFSVVDGKVCITYDDGT